MVLQYFTLGQTMQGPTAFLWFPFVISRLRLKKKLACSLGQLRFKISIPDACISLGDDDDDDCFYTTLFSALERVCSGCLHNASSKIKSLRIVG